MANMMLTSYGSYCHDSFNFSLRFLFSVLLYFFTAARRTQCGSGSGSQAVTRRVSTLPCARRSAPFVPGSCSAHPVSCPYPRPTQRLLYRRPRSGGCRASALGRAGPTHAPRPPALLLQASWQTEEEGAFLQVSAWPSPCAAFSGPTSQRSWRPRVTGSRRRVPEDGLTLQLAHLIWLSTPRPAHARGRLWAPGIEKD